MAAVALPVVGLGVGAWAEARSAPSHSATAAVLVQPLEGNPYRPGVTGEQLVNLTTEAESVRSTDLAARTLRTLGSDEDPQRFADAVTAEVPADTQVLEITYTATDGGTARRAAQALATGFLRQRRDRAAAVVRDATDRLDEQIASVDAQLAAVAAARAASPSRSADAALLEQRAAGLAQQLTALAARRSDLASTTLDPGHLVTPAAVRPAGPAASPLAGPALGLAAGLLAAAALVLLASHRRRHAADPAALEASGVPVLAGIGRPEDHLHGPVDTADDVRRLRAAVLAQHRRRPLTLLVTHAADDAPVTPVDLAVAMARSGLGTVVVDATTGGSGPSRVLAPATTTGLADALVGRAAPGDVVMPVAPLLGVVAPGPGLRQLGDLLMSEAMRRVLRQLADAADVVVIAAGRAGTGSTHSLAGMAGATVLELGPSATTTDAVDHEALLRQAGANVLGVALLGRSAERHDRPFVPETGTSLRQLGAATPKALTAPGGGPADGRSARVPP